MKNITLTRMRPVHVQGVIKIEKESFGSPWTAKSFLNEICMENSVSYVAMEENQVAGYILAMRSGEEAHIYKIAVRPSFRRHGIAKTLTQKCLEELKRQACKKAYLEVRSSNKIAVDMYFKLGFKLDGTRKSYYNLPEEDAVLMSCLL